MTDRHQPGHELRSLRMQLQVAQRAVDKMLELLENPAERVDLGDNPAKVAIDGRPYRVQSKTYPPGTDHVTVVLVPDDAPTGST